MTRSSSTARRVALPLSATILGGTLAAVGFAAPAHAATQSIDKSYDYSCHVIAGGLDLRNFAVGVRTVTKLPSTAYVGQRIAPTPVTISLIMPENLRAATYNIVGGRFADGKSTNSAVTLASGGKTLTKVFTVAAGKTAIPGTAGTPWVIPAKGTVPAIDVPGYATGSITASMPQQFNVVANIYTDGDTAPATMDCSTAADRTLGAISVVKDTTKPKFAKKSYSITTKKNKKKTITVRATDALGDRVTYKLVKKTKKGSVSVKGGKVTFKPKKNFKGKTSFYVGATDGRTGWVKVKVSVKVKK